MKNPLVRKLRSITAVTASFFSGVMLVVSCGGGDSTTADPNPVVQIMMAIDVLFDSASSSLKAGNVQGAVDEMDGRIVELEKIVSAPSSSACPTGMVDARGFCIDQGENSRLDWFAAAQFCQEEGKRLCSPAEMVGACRDNTFIPNLNDLRGDGSALVEGEWTDDVDTSGSGGPNRMVIIYDSCNKLIPTAFDVNYGNNTVGQAFRCCLDKGIH